VELTIENPANGALIECKNSGTENEVVDKCETLASLEYQTILLEEAGEMPSYPFSFLPSRMRKREGLDFRIIMRLATNPYADSWFKDTFLNTPLNVLAEQDTWFYPSSYLDNPYIDSKEYEEKLKKLDYYNYHRLKDGVWDIVVVDGLLIRMADIERNTITKLGDLSNNLNILSIDPSGRGQDSTAVMLVSYNNTNKEYKIVNSTSFTERKTLEEDLKNYIRNSPHKIHIILNEGAVAAEKDTSINY
jgi:hypothetical protein